MSTDKRGTLVEEFWLRQRENNLAKKRRDERRDPGALRSGVALLIERCQRVISEIDKLDGQWHTASAALIDDAVMLGDMYVYVPLNIDIQSDWDIARRVLSGDRT